MRLNPGCDACGIYDRSFMCDHCGVKICAECCTILEEKITDKYGGEYQHLCRGCEDGISVDGRSYSDGPQLIILNGGKDDV